MDLLRILRERNPRTVGVDGNSGSGKTTVAKGIAEALGAQLIPMDFFHKHERSRWHLLPDMEDFEDLEKLSMLLRRLEAGETVEMDGLYEFVTGTHARSHRFEPRPVLVIEGLCVSRLPLDYKIFLDPEPAVAHDRAKRRDQAERGLTEEQWEVKKRLFHHEYRKLIPELKAKSHLVIDTSADVPFFTGPGDASYAA